MVLKSKPSGFTLIEVLVAMAIAGIIATLGFYFVKEYGNGIRKGMRNFQNRHSEAVWVASLEKGLREGQGLFEISEQSLVYFTRGHQKMRLEKNRDDSVLWNGNPSPIEMPGLEFQVAGPDCEPLFTESDPDCRTLMDTLDTNRDGILELDELDRNRDGVVSGRETRFVRWVEIRWQSTLEGKRRSLTIHPRLRLEALPEANDF